jgi:hypothetical protein
VAAIKTFHPSLERRPLNALWKPDALELFGSPLREFLQALFDHRTSHRSLLEDVILHGAVGVAKFYPRALRLDK